MNTEYSKLILVWTEHKSQLEFPIGRLTFDGEIYTFEYINEVKLAQESGFQPLMNFPDLNKVYSSKELFAFFANRIMQPSRPDYQNYLAKYDLSADNVEFMELLKRTQAIKQTDNYKVKIDNGQYQPLKFE